MRRRNSTVKTTGTIGVLLIGVQNGTPTSNLYGLLIDTEKDHFNDRGWLVCDFKWSSIALIKPIGSLSVEYIELRLKADPYRFVGNIMRISEQVPTVHGRLTFANDINSVEGDTLIECCDKLMAALKDILSVKKCSILTI